MNSPQTPGLSAPSTSGRTRPSIRRLFRVKSTNEALLKQPVAQDIHTYPEPIIESSPGSRVFRSQTEQRPTSSRSTRSVRSMFSSAKRIALRPSALFRHNKATGAVFEQENKDNFQASHSQPMQRSVSHYAGAILLDNHDMQAVQQPPHNLQLNAGISAPAFRTPDTVSSNGDSCSRRPRMPTTPLPAIPRNPSTEHHLEAKSPQPPKQQIKSPTSFSSKSLGLHSLDFEYNQNAIDGLLPASPPMSSLQGKDTDTEADIDIGIDANENVDAVSALPMSPGTDEGFVVDMEWDENTDHSGFECSNENQSPSDCVIDLVDIHTLEELDNASETLRPSDTIPTSQPTASPTASSTFKSCPYSSLAPCHSAGAGALSLTKKSPVSVSQIILSDPELDASASPTLDNPDFVVRDIDQLLRELGLADAFVQGADVESANGESTTLPLLGCDSDIISAREIDELVETLDNAESAKQATSSALSTNEVALYDVVPSFAAVSGNNDSASMDIDAALAEDIEEASCFVEQIAEMAVVPMLCANKSFDSESLVFELDVVVQSFVDQIGKQQLVSATETRYQLGTLANGLSVVPYMPVAPKISPLAVDVLSIVSELANAELLLPFVRSLLLTSRLSYTPAAFVDALIDTNSIESVPAIAAPTTSQMVEMVEIAKVVEMADASDASAPTTPLNAPTSPSLGIPNLISDLGGVYTPEYMVHNMERVRKSSTQTLVGDIDHDTFNKPTGSLLCEFKYEKFPELARSKQQVYTTIGDFRYEMFMDVDEDIQETRSRAMSLVSVANSDSFNHINRLISALRLPPIIVSRPFLGPLRNVLFSDLC
ncbi:hypothetical protein IWW45_002258 [Coemansia sp. RSA 485]|nr:hypothetical protein IWW45_002258 [Coemansia sp. RSA 485]